MQFPFTHILGATIVDEKDTIHCPDNLERIMQLQVKCKEYKQRISHQSESERTRNRGSEYKMIILSIVLSEGSAQYQKVYAALKASDPNFAGSQLLTSWDVIEDYTLTGGINVSGGGLPNLQRESTQ